MDSHLHRLSRRYNEVCVGGGQAVLYIFPRRSHDQFEVTLELFWCHRGFGSGFEVILVESILMAKSQQKLICSETWTYWAALPLHGLCRTE